jgi:hypothetical protein
MIVKGKVSVWLNGVKLPTYRETLHSFHREGAAKEVHVIQRGIRCGLTGAWRFRDNEIVDMMPEIQQLHRRDKCGCHTWYFDGQHEIRFFFWRRLSYVLREWLHGRWIGWWTI